MTDLSKDKLVVKNLEVSVDNEKILKGVNLEIGKGEVVALMGPNGSGKSTLANVIMGNPNYKIDSGEVTYKGKNILELSPDKRSKLGIFLSFQYPSAITGVTVANFLRTAMQSRLGKNEKIDILKFYDEIKEKADELNIDESFLSRYLNDGFSGGEKKITEILQMAVLKPEIAILDETDSGLDVDALKAVASGINKIRSDNMGVLIITHYQRILNYIKPDRVIVMNKGKIVKSGGPELAEEIEEKGYEGLI